MASTSTSPQQKPMTATKKSPGITRSIQPPVIPSGEDAVSFERHNNILRSDWKKRRPNMIVANELMEQSFAMRWDDLHSNVYQYSPSIHFYKTMTRFVISFACLSFMQQGL